MFVVLWEFRTRAAVRERFVRAYGANGAWAKLFHRAPGYAATKLLRDPKDSLRYFTVDVWSSQAAYNAARRALRKEYQALDLKCEKWTQSEKRIGWFSARVSRARVAGEAK